MNQPVLASPVISSLDWAPESLRTDRREISHISIESRGGPRWLGQQYDWLPPIEGWWSRSKA